MTQDRSSQGNNAAAEFAERPWDVLKNYKMAIVESGVAWNHGHLICENRTGSYYIYRLTGDQAEKTYLSVAFSEASAKDQIKKWYSARIKATNNQLAEEWARSEPKTSWLEH